MCQYGVVAEEIAWLSLLEGVVNDAKKQDVLNVISLREGIDIVA